MIDELYGSVKVKKGKTTDIEKAIEIAKYLKARSDATEYTRPKRIAKKHPNKTRKPHK